MNSPYHDKPTVLVPVGVYLPGTEGGGPIRSITNLIERLSETYEFRVLTSKENIREVGAANRYQTGTWVDIGPCPVRYLNSVEQQLPYVASIIMQMDVDVIYLNAFFPTPFTLPVLVLKRLGLLANTSVILAPRGQLYEGAFQQKQWKKSVFLMAAKAMGFYDNLVWQATTEEERTQITGEFGELSDIQLAPNLGTLPYTDIEEKSNWATTESGQLNAAFVSRIAPKKNLDGALRLLRRVDGEVTYDIYGPIWDENYWEECQSIIASLPSNVRVNHHGSVPHDEVFEVFSEHALFLFPTHGENFGHVIFEALVSGCPVLVSQSTPWRGLREKCVGWDVSGDDPDAMIEVLQSCIDADETQYRKWRRRAVEYALNKGKDSEEVKQTRELFRHAVSRSER